MVYSKKIFTSLLNDVTYRHLNLKEVTTHQFDVKKQVFHDQIRIRTNGRQGNMYLYDN